MRWSRRTASAPISTRGWRRVVSAGRKIAGLGDIVEADHGQVLGDAAAQALGGLERAQGHLIVAGKDRVQAGLLARGAVRGRGRRWLGTNRR